MAKDPRAELGKIVGDVRASLEAQRAMGVEWVDARWPESPAPPPPPKPSGGQEVLFKEVILKPEEEHSKILKLYENLKDCKETYHDSSSLPSLGAFEQFVSQKAEQLKKSEHCTSVAFMIVLVDDHVKFQAAPVRSTDPAPTEPVKS